MHNRILVFPISTIDQNDTSKISIDQLNDNRSEKNDRFLFSLQIIGKALAHKPQFWEDKEA